MNIYSRRGFLGGCVALGVLPAVRSVAAAVAAKPVLKLGVLSDIHIQKPGQEETFRKALEYFRSCRVDGVLIAGDFADTGRISQMKLLADTWYAVFPDGKYADGKRCEQLFVYGNHCVLGWKWGCNKDLVENPEHARADGIGFEDNRSRAWKELLHEDYTPVWIKKINGCTIVGAHWDSWTLPGWSLSEFLEKHKDEIDPSMPFIYMQHDHPGGTVMGPWAWGNDHGRSTAVLAKYPNCIVFSGHSHYTLTDERSVWQGAFTSINTSSLKYSSVDYALRDNMAGNGWGYQGDKRKHETPRIDTADGRQGQIVTFYSDHIDIERREFNYGCKSLGPNWIVPFPAKNDPVMSFEKRAALRHAPEFAPDAVLAVEQKTQQDGRKTIEVTIPHARTVDGCRPYEYEVTFTLTEDDVELVQLQSRVLAAGFYLPEELSDKPTKFAVNANELPLKGKYRISVRPIECFRHCGREICYNTTL